MKKTFKRDVALLDTVIPISRELGSMGIPSAVYERLWVEKLEGREHGLLSSREFLARSIEQVRAAHPHDLTRDQAAKLQQYVDGDDERVVAFLRLNWEFGWRNDVKSLEAERYVLAKFVGDAEYPRWVCSKAYYAFESAMAPIKYYNRVVSGLHRCGRRGLYMSDSELARVGSSP